ncbi:MAG: helix-turn-helix domain-containing protein [Rhodobacteraceae bacterium]|nr:helix-turn-helix domain-containing protein [Paracoccaceae bacterium]
MDQPVSPPNHLGRWLKDRRARLDPASFGFPASRRRTPGLRREEVAQRANISTAWYTWLEQGRGGAPSADVLDRIARALLLTEAEREHLFLLGLGRAPERRARDGGTITPRLQRVLDALEPCPALIRTASWDVVAWNRAVPVMLNDYGRLPEGNRNMLRQLFLDSRVRSVYEDWEGVARHIVGVFRGDAARATDRSPHDAVIESLSRESAEFAEMWSANEVRENQGGLKRIVHPELGAIEVEYSFFTVHDRPDLSMVVFAPVNASDAARVAEQIARRGSGTGASLED